VTITVLEECRLALVAGEWPFAVARALEISRHWETATAANPALFNGEIFVVADWRIENGCLEARMLETKFAAYLYWRATGFAGSDCDEAFATTVVLSREGGMLVARAVDGTLNEGHYLPPGGLIDGRDVTGAGLLDPAAAATRELAEEAGLCAPFATRRPGFLLARNAPYLAIATVFDVDASDAELIAHVERYVASQVQPELIDPQILKRRADLDRVRLTTPTRLLGAYVLD